MIYVVLTIASVLIAAWLVLLILSNREDWIAAAYGKLLANLDRIDSLTKKDAVKAAQIEKCRGVELRIRRLFAGSGHEKETAKLKKKNRALQQGDLRGVPVFEIPGYTAERLIPAIGMGNIHKGILEKYSELYGKKYADRRARALMAKAISYPLLCVPVVLAVGVIMYYMAGLMPGIGVMGIGTLITLVLVYSMYDELTDRLNKRRERISRQFPNVVSKLALLVTSGMIMDRAWQETSMSREEELYYEMRKTSEELSNLVDPATAYSNFIDRCNTKETTKLASAIIQNLSKGNAEIGRLLKSMAHEAWQERRHTAKRDAEAANSRLMIPTMMLFVAILIIIMVPVMMSFSGI